jgi:hypothetical protein
MNSVNNNLAKVVGGLIGGVFLLGVAIAFVIY